MAKVKTVVAGRKRRKKILRSSKGYWGGRHRLFQTAKESVAKALQYAYRDRRRKKRELRRLWILRIGAASRKFGLPYRTFIMGLKANKIRLDRKILSELALSDPKAFERLALLAKEAINGQRS